MSTDVRGANRKVGASSSLPGEAFIGGQRRTRRLRLTCLFKSWKCFRRQ